MGLAGMNVYSVATQDYPEVAMPENLTLPSGCTPEGTSLFTVEKISRQAEFGAIREEWNELLGSSDSDCFFLTWEWLSTWCKHLGEEDSLAISVVRHEGELVAIAPFRLRHASLVDKRPFATVEFLGSGHAGSDYVDLFIRKGYEAGAMNALIEAGGHSALPHVMLKWNNLRKGDCLARRFADLLNCVGWTVDEATINICPYISLKDHTWESYLSGLGAEHRADFRRKWKRLQRDHEVRFEQVADAEDCRPTIDLLIRNHNERWRSRGGSDAFHTPELVAFHHDVSLLTLDKGWLRLYVLRLNGHPAAFVYGFLYRNKFYFYQSAFDAAYEKYSVGMISMGLAIQSSIAEGAEEYDLLHGDESYKSHWSHESRPLSRLELYPPGLQGWLCRRAITAGRLLRNADSDVKEAAAGKGAATT